MGKLEPVSPVSPAQMDSELDLVPARFSKEELIQNMDRVDREITMVEQQICKLRKKQVEVQYISSLSLFLSSLSSLSLCVSLSLSLSLGIMCVKKVGTTNCIVVREC